MVEESAPEEREEWGFVEEAGLERREFVAKKSDFVSFTI